MNKEAGSSAWTSAKPLSAYELLALFWLLLRSFSGGWLSSLIANRAILMIHVCAPWWTRQGEAMPLWLPRQIKRTRYEVKLANCRPWGETKIGFPPTFLELWGHPCIVTEHHFKKAVEETEPTEKVCEQLALPAQRSKSGWENIYRVATVTK